MNNYRRMMVPHRHRPTRLQLATLPRKYFAIKNIKAATSTTTRRYNIIDEFLDESTTKSKASCA
jgi:hypothetical protein